VDSGQWAGILGMRMNSTTTSHAFAGFNAGWAIEADDVRRGVRVVPGCSFRKCATKANRLRTAKIRSK
jgi:hypothetical protein